MTAARTLTATLLCALLTAACSEKAENPQQPNRPPTSTAGELRPNRPSLTDSYAALRSRQIANVHYQLSVKLNAESESFSGRVVATTELAKPPEQSLTIDFAGGSVESVKVDGKEAPFEYNGNFITLAPELLGQGERRIAIDYRHPYSTDGSGLHRFKDPEDGSVYLYTHFEPYKANRFFPHFDQPDLKARYTLDVEAPADWTVVSAARESKVQQLENGHKHWRFPATSKFSSYIFPLHAGPYVIWEDDADGIPLRLMARKTLAENVKPQDWFTFTKQSFAFFQDYFGIDYPFVKYDQVIVPDFTIGAMENVAAVTFNEAYVSRGEKTQAERLRLANVIAHEMSHMWFGDLVTMRWWNGLWLKESFATYMASLALAENSEFNDVWENFYLGSKQWAYGADQLVTTHPIEVSVPDTDQAFSNFDGITYGKGGSVLKQLPYYLGKDTFRKGVHNYLSEYAYGNAELQDFMGALGKAAGKDLDEWQQQWLYQPGLNTLSATYQCTDDRISKLTLKQTAPEEYPTLREQKVQLGIYRHQNESMVRVAKVPVTYRGATTQVPQAEGLPCPQILYPNDGDWAYVKVALDDRSIDQTSRHINNIESAFTRLALWQSLYDSVLDAKLPLADYIRFALGNAAPEQNINVIRLISRHLQSSAEYLYRIPMDDKLRENLLQSIERFVWYQLQNAGAGSDTQKTWFDAFTEVAHSDGALKNANALLQGELQIDGLKIDQDKRWQLIVLLNRHLHGQYEQLVKNELKKDNTDRAQNTAITARAIRPDAQIKSEWLDNILNRRDQYKLSQIKAAAGSLFPAEQLALYRDISPRLFSAVPQVSETADTLYNKAYAMLFPVVCSENDIGQYSQTLEQNPELMPALGKVLKNRRQQSEWCMAMAEQPGQT